MLFHQFFLSTLELIIHFPFLKPLCFSAVRSSSLLWGGLGAGAESKAERMDWYSSQTTGLLLEAPFKPNVNEPLKPVCSSLLNEKPTSECAGSAAKPLASLESNKVMQSGEVKRVWTSHLFDGYWSFHKKRLNFYTFICSDIEKMNRDIKPLRIKLIREDMRLEQASMMKISRHSMKLSCGTKRTCG